MRDVVFVIFFFVAPSLLSLFILHLLYDLRLLLHLHSRHPLLILSCLISLLSLVLLALIVSWHDTINSLVVNFHQNRSSST